MRENSSLDATAGTVAGEVSTRVRALQDRFRANFAEIFGNPNAPRTVVIVPSLSFDADVMVKISGVHICCCACPERGSSTSPARPSPIRLSTIICI